MSWTVVDIHGHSWSRFRGCWYSALGMYTPLLRDGRLPSVVEFHGDVQFAAERICVPFEGFDVDMADSPEFDGADPVLVNSHSGGYLLLGEVPVFSCGFEVGCLLRVLHVVVCLLGC